jgi:uncharacterized protein YqhQ
MTAETIDPSNPDRLTALSAPFIDQDNNRSQEEDEKERERKRELIRWTNFWLIVVATVFIAFCLPAIIRLVPEMVGTFLKKIEISHPTKFLIAMAVFSTAIFALYAVLLPFLQPKSGLKPRWKAAFFSVVIFYTIASFGLGTYYFDLALHEDSATWINLTNIKVSIDSIPFIAGILRWLITILFYTHTLLFVALILLMDYLAWRGASHVDEKEQEKKQYEFEKIVWFIDMPMVAGVFYANVLAIVYPFGQIEGQEGRELFLSGAVALQLLVANMQLLLFPYFEYFRKDTRDSKTERSDLKFGSSDVAQQPTPENPPPDKASGEDVADMSAEIHVGEQSRPPPPKSAPAPDKPDTDGQAAAHEDSDLPSPTADPSKDGQISTH